jgi:hypothetical protein
MQKNALWPTFLCGVSRPYVCVHGFVTLANLEKLRDLVEKGQLDVIIDSVWKMEDVLLVSAVLTRNKIQSMTDWNIGI